MRRAPHPAGGGAYCKVLGWAVSDARGAVLAGGGGREGRGRASREEAQHSSASPKYVRALILKRDGRRDQIN